MVQMPGRVQLGRLSVMCSHPSAVPLSSPGIPASAAGLQVHPELPHPGRSQTHPDPPGPPGVRISGGSEEEGESLRSPP